MAWSSDMSHQMTLPVWLRLQINEGRYPGLEWLPDEKDHFKLPWVGQGEPGWENCYQLFRDWSSRDGKNANLSAQDVKQRFRSAINKSQHVTKIEKVDKQTGSYVVYKFLSSEEVSHAKKLRKLNNGKNSRNSSSDQSVYGCNIDDGQLKTIDKSWIPDTYTQAQMSENTHYDENLTHPVQPQTFQESVFNFDGSSAFPSPLKGEGFDLNVLEQEQALCWNELNKQDGMEASFASSEFGSDEYRSVVVSRLNSLSVTADDFNSCQLTVSYNGVNVLDKTLHKLDEGYHILYASSPSDVDRLRKLMRKKIERNGNLPEETIQLPHATQSKSVQKILDHTIVGMFLWYDPKTLSLHVKRMCQSQVFYINIHSKDYLNEEAKKIAIYEKQMIFSYRKFLEHMGFNNVEGAIGRSYLEGSSMPETDVTIVIGAYPSPMREGPCKKGIKITIRPSGAVKSLQKQDNSNSLVQPCLSDNMTSLEDMFRQCKMSDSPSCQF